MWQQIALPWIACCLTLRPYATLQAPLVSTGPADPAVVVASLRRNLEALSQLSNERAGELLQSETLKPGGVQPC